MERKPGMNGISQHVRRVCIIALTLVLLLSTQPAWAAEPGTMAPEKTELTAESAKAFLDEFFASDIAKSMYTGAAVVIVKDGEVLAKEGYGYADAAAEKAVDPDTTVFRLASVSKTFTAVAVMQLAEQGKLDLDGDIRQYLPEGLSYFNPYETPVTVADLLTHRSGFAPSEPLPTDMVTDLSLYVSLEDYAKERMPYVVREPGSAYKYDNYAYLLLGLIVQNVSGQPYETYMADHVFAPLGMTMSGFELKGDLLDNVAVAYDAAGQPYDTYFYLPNIMPHGGMLATAGDVARFMAAFLNDGETPDGGRIVAPATVKEMEAYRSLIHPLLPDTTYGFESPMLLPQMASSTRVITKYGDLPGNSSMLMFIPEEEVGVFLTYNTNGVLRNVFYQQFMGTFFPEDLIPLAAPAGFEPDDATELARYEGLYVDLRMSGIVSRISVAEQDGQAFLTTHDAYVGTRPLEQIGEHLFVDSLARTLVAFGVDGEGRVTHLREGVLNPLGYAEKAPEGVGFADVADDSPYAPYIRVWQSLGLYPNDASQSFRPDEPVTRAELARDLLVISGLTQAIPRDTYAFADIAGHELAPFIQMAADMGMVLGDGRGNFHPDRLAARQEAAVMVWNVYRNVYPLEAINQETALAGEYDSWAENAIRMAVTFGLYGPEVVSNADGSVDFLGKATLTRQEAAAFYYQLMFQPVQQMAAQLMQQAQAE
jgi:CubicO group peptidase (beta-lactamase class C family)